MKTGKMWTEYQTALLNNDAVQIKYFKGKLLNSGNGTEADFANANQWLEQCNQIKEKTLKAISDGVFRNSMSFDALEQEIAQQGEAFVQFMGFAIDQAYKDRFSSSKTENINKMNKKKSPVSPVEDKPKKKSKGEILQLIGELFKRGNKKELKEVTKEALSLYPLIQPEIDQRIQTEKTYKDFISRARKLGLADKSQKDLDLLLSQLKKMQLNNPYIAGKIRKSYEDAVATRERNEKNLEFSKQVQSAAVAVKAKSTSLSTGLKPAELSELTFTDIHPNFISQLTPAKKWTVLIDETGQCFDTAAFKKKSKPSEKGKLVAILVPDYCKLPELKAGFHSNSESFKTMQKVYADIFSSPCGVLGIPVDGLHKLDADLWYIGIETLIDLILRLIPVSNKTHVDILVEKREITPEKSELLQKSCERCLNQLSRNNPYRADVFSLTGKVIKKTDHPWNGYADALAFCWGGTTVSSLLEHYQWKDTCLFDSNPELLRQAIDALTVLKPLSEDEWTELIKHSSPENTNSIANVILQNLGEMVQNDSELWNMYLNFVQNHLYSKAIDLRQLSKQIGWLKIYKPVDAEISPKLRLIWLTTQLAENNHLGRTGLFEQFQKEFEDLCNSLFEEDAPLTCLATLHIAVEKMDCFNFKDAYRIVKPWLKQNEAIPGRKCFGQVLSTIGQLNAFIGNQNAAVEAFDKALEKFSLLTDKKQGQSEAGQTLAYKVIAMMDSDPVPENMVSTLETYLGMSLTEAAERFSVNADVADKYRHHILLRYLANNPDSQAAKVYLDNQGKWAAADLYHPWELIEFYRGLLISDAEKRNAYFRSGYKIAAAGHGPLQVIAAVILGGIYYSDSSVKEELASLTSSIIESMPYLGKERIKALNAQIAEPISPLELAKAILPFNFR